MKKLALITALVLSLLLAVGCGKGNGTDNAGENGGSGTTEASTVDNGSSQETGVMPDKFSFSGGTGRVGISCRNIVFRNDARSEEHTSNPVTNLNLVCRLLLGAHV